MHAWLCLSAKIILPLWLLFKMSHTAFAVPSSLLTQYLNDTCLWVMTTEIPSPGWIFGSLGMIHLASPSYPAALWRAFSPDKLNIWCCAPGSWRSQSFTLLWCFGLLRCCTVTPARGWRSAHLPRAPGPSLGASFQTLPFARWCHKVKGTDGVSVEFLLVLRMLQSAGQALPEGYGCPAVVLLPVFVWGSIHELISTKTMLFSKKLVCTSYISENGTGAVRTIFSNTLRKGKGWTVRCLSSTESCKI